MISYEKITGCNKNKEGIKCIIIIILKIMLIINYMFVINDMIFFKGFDYRVYISGIDKKEAMII